MRILFKFMFKNMSEKKLRSLLIIISIMVAAAMSLHLWEYLNPMLAWF
nr:hypothetical protein [Clostridium botulinum]